MRGLLDDLTALLAAEAEALRRLLPLLQEEERALLRAEAGAVGGLLDQIGALTRRLSALEHARRTLSGRLAVALGIDPETLTLSTLLRRFPHPPAGLAALREELRGLLESLLALNSRNGFLVEQSLGYLRGLLATLVSALAPAPTYAPSGRTDQSVPALQFFDRRA